MENEDNVLNLNLELTDGSQTLKEGLQKLLQYLLFKY